MSETELNNALIINLILIASCYSIAMSQQEKLSRFFASKFFLQKKYPLLNVIGAIRVPLVSCFSGITAFSLLATLNLSLKKLLPVNNNPIYILYGILLGIGLAGVSLFISQLLTVGINTCKARDSAIVNSSNLSGNHVNARYIFSVYIWFPILLIQLASEEIIFRGACLHIFLHASMGIAILISTTLFVFMDLITAPLTTDTMFSMIGSLLVGTIHGYLFAITNNIVPLIVSHVVFFIFVVL